jgi:hypothetical protein
VDEVISLPLCGGVDAARGGGSDDGGGELVPREVSGRPTHWRRWAELRARSAELRMRQAYAALEAAEMAGRCSSRELERLEVIYLQGVESYRAAMALLHSLHGEGADGSGRLGSAS